MSETEASGCETSAVAASLRQLVLLGVVSAVVVASGIVVYQTAPPLQFGWFAYTELPDEIPLRSSLLHNRQQVVGAVLAALGLAGACVTAGYALGLRALSSRLDP